MRWRATLLVAVVIVAEGQAVGGSSSQDYNGGKEAKNDNLGVDDRCDNLSPYTKLQLKQHIQLNSRDVTELKDSIESRFASRAASVDKTLMDLQEQRDQDRKQIANLNSRDVTELKDSIESRLASMAALVDKTLMDLQEQRDQDTRQIAILKERVSDLERVTRNTVRFVYVKESKNWNDANEYCKKQYGGQLASILNEKERLKVLALNLSRTWIWIGAKRSLSNNDKFIWNHEDIELPLSNPHWKSGEPYYANYKCVFMYESKYYNYPCSNSLYFICEFR